MEGTWKDYMKVGIVHFMAFPECIKGEGPIVNTVRRVAEDEFFDSADVTWMKDATVRQEVRALASEHGLSLGFSCVPPLLINKHDLNSLDGQERRRAVDMVKECIAGAGELGARGVAFFSGPDPGAKARKKAKAALVESLMEINEHVRSTDLSLGVVMETFDRVPFGKNRLVGPTAEATDICREVRSRFPGFGLLLDLSHLPLVDEGPGEALEAAASCLAEVHIGNCVKSDPGHPAYGDEHPPFGIDGGENDARSLALFLRALMECGYLEKKGQRIVSFEVKPFGDWTSESVIDNCKQTLEEAWRLT